MYEYFQRTIELCNYQIEKGFYVTYTKLYKELYALESEIDFAYRYELLSHIEFNQLKGEIKNTLLLFRKWKEQSVSN